MILINIRGFKIPTPVSKKQFRYMMAILHGKSSKTSSRGDRVPKSVAGKYAGSGSPDNLPDSKGKEHSGGIWGEKGHSKQKDKTKKERLDRKKNKRLKKAIHDYLMKSGKQGAGCLVIDDEGCILLGQRTDNMLWSTPGGKVDPGENFNEAALRELKEESGLTAKNCQEILSRKYGAYDSKTFLVKDFKGNLKNNDEMKSLKFFKPHEIPWEKLTDYTCDAICHFVQEKLKKSKNLDDMVLYEELNKNIIRSGGSTPDNTVYEVTHGDALRLIGNGTFRMLRDAVKDMGDEDFRELKIDNYTLHIRKHVNDVYSGRITDGLKQIHQFTSKSLPAISAELMSVFEWYHPEDEKEIELLDEDELNQDVIDGGLNELISSYKQHNISNIYMEMENIREELRHGTAVDLQQVEQRMMKLFDKLEDSLTTVIMQHNALNDEAGSAIDMLEHKLMKLQESVERLSQRPVTVDAYSVDPNNDTRVHSQYYPYLSKPSVIISPTGEIKISFSSDWSSMERENFLKDMRAKVIRKTKKTND